MSADPPRPLPSGPPPGAVAPPTGGRSPDLCGKTLARILVVDDDPDVRKVVGGMLQRCNYHVDMAGDGAVGWEALCTNSYDLVITDHMMPKLTGLDLLRRLRAVRVDLPCILISGDLPLVEDDLAPLIRPGHAVEKPVKLNNLATMVRALLAAHPIGPSAPQSGNEPPSMCPA